MEIGHLNSMQNLTDASDYDAFHGEVGLALAAETHGFDSLWCVEHHFSDYGMCGDNLQYLAYIAAHTRRAKLVPGAIILPWHDPLRVIEKMSLLEYYAPGRTGIGLGRGLAKREYDSFRQDMNESRERFDEAAEMVLRGLSTGIAEGNGPFYVQPRTPIRPKPLRGYSDEDLYSIAMSPNSALAAADLGARMMTFIQGPIENHLPMIDTWRDRFKERHPTHALPDPVLTDCTVCHEDPDEASRLAHTYLKNHYVSIVEHYNFDGDHFQRTKGYEAYQAGSDDIKEQGMERKIQDYVDGQNWGTPNEIVEKYAARREVVGNFSALIEASYGGIPFDAAHNTIRLFGEKVIPELKKMATRSKETVVIE